MTKSIALLVVAAATLLSSCAPPSSFVKGGETSEELIKEGSYKAYGSLDCFRASSAQTAPTKMQSKVFRTNDRTATGEVMHAFGRRKVRPATPQELLSYVAQWRKRIPKSGKLVALGDPASSGDAAAFFYDKEGLPSLICILDGTHPEKMWEADNSFLAVK